MPLFAIVSPLSSVITYQFRPFFNRLTCHHFLKHWTTFWWSHGWPSPFFGCWSRHRGFEVETVSMWSSFFHQSCWQDLWRLGALPCIASHSWWIPMDPYEKMGTILLLNKSILDDGSLWQKEVILWYWCVVYCSEALWLPIRQPFYEIAEYFELLICIYLDIRYWCPKPHSIFAIANHILLIDIAMYCLFLLKKPFHSPIQNTSRRGAV